MLLQRLGLRKKRTCIGVDVGTTGFRAVQLERIDGTWCVTRIARSELGLSEEPAPDHDRRDLAQRLVRLVKGEPFHGRAAATAVQTPDIEFHPLELPEQAVASGRSDANDIVRWELSRLLNETPDQIQVSHWSLPPTSALGPNAMGAAARRAPVVDLYAACVEAGLQCERVDGMPTALQRFGAHLRRWSHREVWGLVDLGAQKSRLIVSIGQTPVLARDIGSGGLAWTRAIADTLQVSHKAAEVHKREHGIAFQGRGMRADDASVPSAELAGMVFGALRQELASLAAEIKRSYEYILSRYGACTAGELVLVGGGAALPHLDGYLGRALGIPVLTAGSCLDDAEGALRFHSARGLRLERLAGAIGIALDDREVADEA